MPATAAPTEQVRARVLAGMAAAVAEKGYAGVTISDVARNARISKSTFYAQFADKQECFLAAYEAAAEAVATAIVEAARTPGTRRERAAAATRAYLEALAADPALTRTFIVEVLAAGPAALTARNEVNRRFAAVLAELVAASGLGRLSTEAARLVVGGIDELVLAAVVEGRVSDLPRLQDTIVDVVGAAAGSRAPAP